MQQSAVAYFTNGRIVIAAVSRTVAGVHIGTSPNWFGKSAKKAVIAQAIAEALAASQVDIPHPTPEQWKRQFIPFQDAAAVKNFKTFMRDAQQVDIDRTGNTVSLTPSDNLGVKNGFEPRPNDVRTVPADDLEAAAAALLMLFGLRPNMAPPSADA